MLCGPRTSLISGSSCSRLAESGRTQGEEKNERKENVEDEKDVEKHVNEEDEAGKKNVRPLIVVALSKKFLLRPCSVGRRRLSPVCVLGRRIQYRPDPLFLPILIPSRGGIPAFSVSTI